MKKIVIFALSGLLAWAGCKKAEDATTVAVPQQKTVAQKPPAPVVEKTKFTDAEKLAAEREFVAQQAKWYLAALADSLLSTIDTSSTNVTVGRGFPKAIRTVETRFTSKAFRVACGIDFHGSDDSVNMKPRVMVMDSLGRKSDY